MGNVSYSAHISNGKSAITSKSKLLGVAKHNLRKYKSPKYSSDNILLLRGTEDLYQDVKNVYHQEFDEAVQQYNQKQAEELIMEEKLNEEAAKRYILTSLRKEYASENGTDLNEILPKMSPLNPQYHTKKQSVFEKISTFVEKFKGVGGVI